MFYGEVKRRLSLYSKEAFVHGYRRMDGLKGRFFHNFIKYLNFSGLVTEFKDRISFQKGRIVCSGSPKLDFHINIWSLCRIDSHKMLNLNGYLVKISFIFMPSCGVIL